ncbi:MAG: DUF5721 family protein [Eubacteriales bacterium]|nr:DUF5721 family protein [Eubacteriales bacterium]
MFALPISETKSFMNRLLLSDSFDHFLAAEAAITTFAEFHIAGKLQKDYYSSEELEELQLQDQQLVSWKQLRPFFLQLIRGTHTPLSFKIVLKLPASATEELLAQSALPYSPADIHGLFLNLHFQNGVLTCISGTSMALFTTDKSLDHAWDDALKTLLRDFL